MQLVIPLAGQGSRFAKAGYRVFKPMLPLFGRSMLECVIRNMMFDGIDSVLLISRNEFALDIQVVADQLSVEFGVTIEICVVMGPQNGAADTIWQAHHLIKDGSVLFANSDQLVRKPILMDGLSKLARTSSAKIFVTDASHEKWSYVLPDEKNYPRITMVREKEPISTRATIGVYHFPSGAQLKEILRAYLTPKNLINGEYYLAPIYNLLIESNEKVEMISAGLMSLDFFGVGTPDDYEWFLRNNFDESEFI